MKLQAEVLGNKHEVEISRADGEVTARVDGREYSLDVSQPEAGVYSFRDGAKVVEVYVDAATGEVSIGGRTIDVAITDPKRLRGTTGDAASSDGLVEIKTAMPGKVVRILVADGDTVAKGDGIIVVEAMKMQNELRSPKDGVVREIRFAEGDTVAAGDRLAIIE